MMTSLITGATGFIGRALLRKLVSDGENVIAMCRRPPPTHACDGPVDWCEIPGDKEAWRRLLSRVSTVFHLAWSSLPQLSNEDPVRDASENILGTLRLLDAARDTGVRIVFASSGGTVYGVLSSVPATEQHATHPRCAYGISKLAVEKYLELFCQLWGLDSVSLRVSNAYGPGQDTARNFGAISTFSAHAVRGEPITIFGDGSVIRDYIYIDDVVRAFVAAGGRRNGPPVINIGSGVGKSLNDIVDVLRAACPGNVDVSYVAGRALDVPVSVLDISLAERSLGWKPRISFDTGVRMTLGAIGGLQPLRSDLSVA